MNRFCFALLIMLLVLFSGCSQKEQKPYLLMISFDGFRHDYMQKYATPNFDRLAEQGIISEGLIPTFPANTFPNHYSIATGMHAGNHGLIANSFYDPEFDDFYSMRDRDAVEDGRWYGGEPIWVTAEKQGMRAASFFWVGSEAPVQGIQPTYWKRYDGRVNNFARVDSVIKWLNYPENKRPQLITLYFSDTDSKGHRYGPDSKQLEKAVMHVDSVLGYLIDQVNETNWQDKLNIILVSDHGMAQTDSTKIILVPGIKDNPDIIRAGDGSTMFLWSQDSLLIEELDDQYDHELEHTFSYTKAEIPDRYHFKSGKRIPDLLLVTEEPYMLAIDEDRRFAEGMHGYDPQNVNMHGLFIAAGPAVKNIGSIPRIENVHIYPFAAEILQLQLNPDIDGKINVLGKYLR